MSRSRALSMTTVALLLALWAPSVHAEEVKVVDAIGNLDYSHGRSSVKVGTWAKYHVRNTGGEGVTDEYAVTILIAGEEEFWGDDCFWVETTTERQGRGPDQVATLLSYSVFDDSLALPHLQVYQRKKIDGMAEGLTEGVRSRILRQGQNAMKARNPFGTPLTWKTDTLGTDTVRTPRGDYVCLMIRREEGAAKTAEDSDSTHYTEVRNWRTVHEALSVPLTHMAREELVSQVSVRAWLIGRSKEAGPLRVAQRSSSEIELLDFGTTGVEARLVPEQFRRYEQRLDVGAGLHGLPHRLDSLHDERRLAPPVLPLGQRAHPPDQRVRGARDHLGHRDGAYSPAAAWPLL